MGRSAEAARLRLPAHDLVALLHTQAPQLSTADPRDDWDRACLYARTATGPAHLAGSDGIVFVKDVPRS
ncbi:hypothetical protein SHO565_22970 [Streptomyces sp. HO565]